MNSFRILGKNPFRWFVESIRRYGLWQTVSIGWSVIVDSRFDARYGTDTARRIPREQISTESENLVHCVNYGASKGMPFHALMRRLRLPEDSVFVDLGSGKGRALMLATMHRFKRIVGVEFSDELCRIARENIAKFLEKEPSQSKIDVFLSDVTRYEFQDDENVFFMLDPFNAPVLALVLKNIQRSLERKPRKIWLVYSVPREQRTIDESGLFTIRQLHTLYGAEFRVFTNHATP